MLNAKRMFKGFIYVMVLTLFCAFVHVGAMALTEPGDSEDNPVLIKSKLDFETFAQEVNDGNDYKGKFIKLDNDIYLTSDETMDGKAISWLSVGICEVNQSSPKIYNGSKPFKGTFDGNGYAINCKINNFCDDEGTATNASIFGYIGRHGLVKNVIIRGLISSEKMNDGVAALCDVNFGTIENCKVRSTVDGTFGVSGLVLVNAGIVQNCDINGKVFSKDLCCAGVCAKNYGVVQSCNVHALLANCKDNGIDNSGVFELPETGGVAAFNYGEVKNCTVDSYITNKNIETLPSYEHYLKQKSDGKSAYIGCAGGIVSTNNGLIENCKFIGSANSYEVGGIAGINYETIKNCESNCKLLGAIVGGVVSQNMVGNKTYSSEAVCEDPGGYIVNCTAKADVKTFFLAGEVACTEYWNDQHATLENTTAQINVEFIK